MEKEKNIVVDKATPETLHDNLWLSKKLGVSLQTARTLHLKCNLPAIRFPGSRLIRYRESEIDEWISEQKTKGGR
ncbi:MAG TPA: hypothetical protein PKK43_14315 [Spirochaetota bacterium]|nr:hypothetical protein [Spirochaetota bacterium]